MLSFLCDISELRMGLQGQLLPGTNSMLIFCQASPAAFLQVPVATRTARGLGRGGVSLKNTQGNGKQINKQTNRVRRSQVPVPQDRGSLGAMSVPPLRWRKTRS